MITGEIKSQIDKIWDAFWSGGISNPLEVIEQMTYLLFVKRLDELHTVREKKANRLGGAIERPIFAADQQHLRWSVFREFGDAKKLYDTIANEVFPFIKTLGDGGGKNGENATYSAHMKDARFTIPTPALLAKVVDMLDAVPMDDRDTKGDVYEYMLGKIATAGQNGQFRTPRHIIKLMVDMMAPTPADTIVDPACGTAGYLVAASEYLTDHYQSEIYATPEAAQRFNHDTFHGFDFDSTMLRIGSMNMLLHGVENPSIENRDSLSENHSEVDSRFSLVLANPPFSGSLDYETTAKDLLALVQTTKTELLFVSLFSRILRIGGRAAVIVPAGVMEADSQAHEDIRRHLVEQLGLQGVVRLPHWVFKPYASVATYILLLQKGAASETVWFYHLENDGYTNSDAKKPIEGSELGDVLSLWRNINDGTYVGNPPKHDSVPVGEIRNQGYDLCYRTYLTRYQYPPSVKTESLGCLFDIHRGSFPASSALRSGDYDFATSSAELKALADFQFDCEAIVIPTVSSTGHGHASLNAVHYLNGKFAAATITSVLIAKPGAEVHVPFFYYLLLTRKEELLIPLMRGATNVSLNPERLKRLKLPKPDLQDQIAATKAMVDSQNDLQKAKEAMSSSVKRLNSAKRDFMQFY